MILVAGGSGRLGSLVVASLARRGVPVRVLTRDPRRADALAGEHVEIVRGDVRDDASVRAAVAGVTAIVSCVHGFAGPGGVSPASVDRDGNARLIDAAARDGARFVLLSATGAAPGSPFELMRMKWAAEQRLAASGVPWTVIRPTAFLELWIDILRQTARRSKRPVVLGEGENPINFVSVTDVAALVVRSALDDAPSCRTLDICGPRNLTFNELAAAVSQAAENGGAPRHVPRPALRVLAATAGRAKPALRRQILAALAMDSTPLASEANAMRLRAPDVPCTPLEEVLAAAALHPTAPDNASTPLAGDMSSTAGPR